MSRYYKILPENMCCKGFQYQEGLNIDTKKITPRQCDNGLHFADAEHILGFCGYGSMIAEVEIPDDAIVYHFCTKSKADRIILKNIRPLWSVETIEDLILDGANFEDHKGDMLFIAARNGYLDIVKYLIEHGITTCSKNDALQDSSANGHLDIVKYLVEQGSDIHALDDYPLRWASHNGHFDIVLYLIEQGADIHTRNDCALRWASEYGYFDIVKCLVEHGADIHAVNDYPLRIASEEGYLDIVKYLIEHGANIHAWDDYAIRHAKTPEIKAYLESLK